MFKFKNKLLQRNKSINWIHAELTFDAVNVSTSRSNKSSDPSSIVIRVKDYSKYGPFIKTDLGKGEKVHELPNKEKILTDEDVITFGTGSATYRLSSSPLVFYFCPFSETFKVDQSVQAAVSSIGAHLSLTWSQECTHVLLEPRMQVNEALVNAILADKPIFLTNWVKLLTEKSICSEIPGYSQYRPSVMVEGALLEVVTKPVAECKTNDAIFQLVLAPITKGVRHALLHNPFHMISSVGTFVLWAQRVFQKRAAPLFERFEILIKSIQPAVYQLHCFKLPLHHVQHNGLLVFPWNLMLLEFFLFIHLEDKVCPSGASNSWCGWLVFDRGKNKIISGDVITLVFLDLKKCFFHGAEKRDVQTMLLVKVKDAHVDSLISSMLPLYVYQMGVSDIQDHDKEMVADPVTQAVLNRVTNTARFGFASVMSQSHAVHLDVKQDFMRNQELTLTQSHKFKVDKFGRLNNTRLTVWRVLCLLGTRFWSTSFKKQKFSKDWWYKFKDSLWQRECGRELLEEELLVPEAILAVRFDDVSPREFWVQWQHSDSSANSWVLSKDLVCFFLAFKLEDKLVLRGESIDTIHGLIVGESDVAADEVEVKTLEQKEVLPLTLRDSNKRRKLSSILIHVICELWICESLSQ